MLSLALLPPYTCRLEHPRHQAISAIALAFEVRPVTRGYSFQPCDLFL
jgi:hypothetical protein